MGSKARRTALSVAGLALASGASLALAAPASAAMQAGDEGYGATQSNTYSAGSEQSTAVSGTYTKVEKTQVAFSHNSTQSAYQQGQSTAWAGGHNGGHHDGCNPGCTDPYGGYHYRKGGYRGGYHWRPGHTRTVGFYRTYRECREAARRGGWDNYDCDFTRRGYRGWHQSWNKWGANDWRCHGAWVLTTSC